MAFKNTITIGVLSKCLRFAILQNKPHIFLPYLLSKHVDTTFSNKLRFYDFFINTLCYAYQISKGPMYLKIEIPNWENEGYLHYCFYDKYHVNSRICIKIKESDLKIYLDIPPF